MALPVVELFTDARWLRLTFTRWVRGRTDHQLRVRNGDGREFRAGLIHRMPADCGGDGWQWEISLLDRYVRGEAKTLREAKRLTEEHILTVVRDLGDRARIITPTPKED